mmetsp:Transcript_25587/g.35324  ORF Transcript_25587/g.35324 Transcript_25587/m.35324 type:complete len:127 (-) Transcript_25587:239-619(-)
MAHLPEVPPGPVGIRPQREAETETGTLRHEEAEEERRTREGGVDPHIEWIKTEDHQAGEIHERRISGEMIGTAVIGEREETGRQEGRDLLEEIDDRLQDMIAIGEIGDENLKIGLSKYPVTSQCKK